jgi:hypothetical protein
MQEDEISRRFFRYVGIALDIATKLGVVSVVITPEHTADSGRTCVFVCVCVCVCVCIVCVCSLVCGMLRFFFRVFFFFGVLYKPKGVLGHSEWARYAMRGKS